ncbi:hypothetical protein BLOT_009860 [Blomia tropicalis]|nr:hypothetical protein BLOT_009860 [Blomia tropicalis]
MLNTKTVMDNIINSLELRSKRRQELFESVRECLENERRSPRYRINPGNDFSLWFETSVPRMNEDVFRSHFRMGRPTFNYIVDMTQVETKPNSLAAVLLLFRLICRILRFRGIFGLVEKDRDRI